MTHRNIHESKDFFFKNGHTGMIYITSPTPSGCPFRSTTVGVFLLNYCGCIFTVSTGYASPLPQHQLS